MSFEQSPDVSHRRPERAAAMARGIPRASADRGFPDDLGIRMQREKRLYRPPRILTRLDKRARHYCHARLADLGEVMLVGVPPDEGERIQDVGQLRSPLYPHQKFRHALSVVPRRTQQSNVERRPVNLGVIPLGYLYVA